MAYSLEQYADLANVTLRQFDRNEWSDIVTDIQEHFAMPMILKKKRVEFDSGWGYQVTARVGSNSPAKNSLINEPDNPTTADMFLPLTGNFRYTTSYFAINEIEMSANRNPSRIVSLLKGKQVDMMTSLADLMEGNFWGKPSDSTDIRTPRGVKYWLVNNNTEGFNGGLPAGFTDVGGISPTTYARWKNWTSQYVKVSKSDGIRKVRKAMTYTRFRPPVPYPSNSGETYDERRAPPENTYQLFSNYNFVQPCEELLESQNDDLGPDLASQDGLVMIRRSPLFWVPYLDADTTNPIIGINWKAWKIYFMEGEYMNETEVKPHPLQHRTLVRYIDCLYDFVCLNRRLNFMITL